MKKGKLGLEFDHGLTYGCGNTAMRVFLLLEGWCEQAGHALFLKALHLTVQGALDLTCLFGAFAWGL